MYKDITFFILSHVCSIKQHILWGFVYDANVYDWRFTVKCTWNTSYLWPSTVSDVKTFIYNVNVETKLFSKYINEHVFLYIVIVTDYIGFILLNTFIFVHYISMYFIQIIKRHCLIEHIHMYIFMYLCRDVKIILLLTYKTFVGIFHLLYSMNCFFYVVVAAAGCWKKWYFKCFVFMTPSLYCCVKYNNESSSHKETRT